MLKLSDKTVTFGFSPTLDDYHQKENSLYGIEFLRDMLQWLDNRTEVKNENKSPIQLLNEYKKHLKESKETGNRKIFIGDKFKHKYISGMTCEITAITAKGAKVLQSETVGESTKTKTQFYHDVYFQDIGRGLWVKIK